MDDEYERVLLTKNEVFVYKIPPLTTSKGHKATDWELDKPLWTGRLQIIAKGSSCYIKLIDKDTGNLFARAPLDSYPGPGIEPVTDSSRYFVTKIVNDADPKRSAFIGMGFADRGDSFDLNVALQDHFKSLKQEEEIAKAGGAEAFIENQPKLDLGFKEGQTIKVQLNIPKKTTSRPKPNALKGGILLPPPPGSSKVAASQANTKKATSSIDNESSAEEKPSSASLVDLEFDKLSMTQRPNNLSSTLSTEKSDSGENNWAQF